MDAPDEVAGMELLARRTRQQREEAGFGSRTLYIRHVWMIHLYRVLILTYQRAGTASAVRELEREQAPGSGPRD
jgi:hypothetical protein